MLCLDLVFFSNFYITVTNVCIVQKHYLFTYKTVNADGETE